MQPNQQQEQNEVINTNFSIKDAEERVLNSLNKPFVKTYKVFKPLGVFEIMNIVKKNNIERKIKPHKLSSKLRRKAELKPEINLEVGDKEIHIDSGSIKDFINSCHPDIKNFLNQNHPYRLKAEVGKLTIDTRNGYRMEIKAESHLRKRVRITDRRRKVVFVGISEYQIKKELMKKVA